MKDAIKGETYEFEEMYPEFAKAAEAVGNKAALMAFTFAMKAEEVHARLYQEALENLDETEEVFYYLCPVCGNIEKPFPRSVPFAAFPEKGSLSTKLLLQNAPSLSVVQREIV